MAVFRICAGPHERERDGSGPRFIRRFICWKLESRCRPISTTTQTIDGHDKNRSPMPIDVFYRVVTGFPRERGRPTNNNNNNKETNKIKNVRVECGDVNFQAAAVFVCAFVERSLFSLGQRRLSFYCRQHSILAVIDARRPLRRSP